MRAMAKRTPKSKAGVKSKPAPKSKPELKSKAKSKAKPEAATAKTPAADPKATEAKAPDARPAKPATAAPAEPGDPLPRDGDRQRARDSPPADSADLREAPLRLEVPQAQNEPGPAGHRYLGGRHVRSADDGQAGADHLAHRRAGRRPLLRRPDRHPEGRA